MTVFKNRLLQLQRLLGRDKQSDSSAEEGIPISSLPGIDVLVNRPNGLPEKCGPFFGTAPLEDDTLLIGRDTELETLETAYHRWRKGCPMSVILTGPQGCGKTSVINCFLRRLPPETRILRMAMQKRLSGKQQVLACFSDLFQIDPPPADTETLIAKLSAAEPRVAVLTGAHHLLLRVIGGREAADTFLYILLCTRKTHFWLLSCRRLPWKVMDRYLDASRYFSQVMKLDALSEDRLRDALDLRTEKCGYPPVFCTSKEEYDLGRPFEEAGEPEKRKEAVYRAVLNNSGRNFQAALFFVLLCSRYDPNTRSLWFYPPRRMIIPSIKEMDHLHQLTLAELAGHGGLSAQEHGRIFRTGDLMSRIILEYLSQARLIAPLGGQPDDSERIYDLLPMAHHSVTATLEQMNLLY